MTARSHFVTLVHVQLVRDTFRQSWASGISGMMLAVTGICVLFCLSVSVSGDVSLEDPDEPVLFLPSSASRAVAPVAGTDRKHWSTLLPAPEAARREGIETVSGRLDLAFGAVSVPLGRARADAVGYLELLLAWGVAGTFGLLLALVWTAGFLPTFLEPGAASVLLAKPVTRRQLLLGKYLGVLTFVALQVLLFVVATWLALGARTGVWNLSYLGCIPVVLVQFAVFYSFSVFLAVLTRSTVASVFGSVLFWLLAWGINYGSVMASGQSESQVVPPATLALAQVAYWVFPKPIDSGLMLFDALDAQHHFEKPALFRLIESAPGFSPTLSILSALALAGVLLALATHEFDATDY